MNGTMGMNSNVKESSHSLRHRLCLPWSQSIINSFVICSPSMEYLDLVLVKVLKDMYFRET